MLVAEVLNSNIYVQLVLNKSHSQELNNVLFVVVVVVQTNGCSLCCQVFNSVLIDGMDVSILTTSLRPIFTVTIV